MSLLEPKRLAAQALLTIGLTLAATANAGEPAAVALCAGCHGVDGNSVAANFPNLAGQQKKYLQRELTDYKSGKRVSEIMAPLVANLSDAEITELAAWYAKQKPAPVALTNPELLPLGKTLYLKGNSKTDVPACDGCHEEDGHGDGKFPRVAGQQVEYVLEQFRLYIAGKRTNGTRVMQTVATRMSEQEARAVAEYMASMP